MTTLPPWASINDPFAQLGWDQASGTYISQTSNQLGMIQQATAAAAAQSRVDPDTLGITIRKVSNGYVVTVGSMQFVAIDAEEIKELVIRGMVTHKLTTV